MTALVKDVIETSDSSLLIHETEERLAASLRLLVNVLSGTNVGYNRRPSVPGQRAVASWTKSSSVDDSVMAGAEESNERGRKDELLIRDMRE